jgi:segregation and condensation protein A
LSTRYHVSLPVFEGPLDLLLQLIEGRELDITKVSLAAVTDQYLEYIGTLEELEAEKLADFLVIAAKLILIKSRMLLPQPPEVPHEDEEEDVGDELVRRLIEYRRFRIAAQGLKAREEQGLRAYARLLPLPELERSFRLEGVTLDALLEAVQQAMLAQPAPSADEVVTPLHISLPEKIAQLEGLAAEQRRFSLNRLLRQATSRMEIVVIFLALLQLIKRRIVLVEQQELFGEIMVSAPGQTPGE